MDSIAIRLREIRDKAGLDRKGVEKESNGEIKATSLSTYENNQSQISISFLKKLVSFYEKKGIYINYDWLITGVGASPEEHKDIINGLSIITESEFFKKNNKDSIILTIKTEDHYPILKIGDIIGAVKVDKEDFLDGLYAIKTDSDFLIKIAKKINNSIIISNVRNTDIDLLPKNAIIELYKIVFFRGQHGNN